MVVTRFPTASRASDVAGRLRNLRPLLADVGIPVPEVVDGSALDPTVVVTGFVDGIVGAAFLDEPFGPELVGRVMGSAARALGEVDLGGVALPLSWSSAGGLAAAEQAGTVAHALGRVDSALRPQVAALVIRARDLLADRPARFVHGDFAPVNAILRDDRLAALVDLEHASRGDPLFDAAWFRWIVAYHHPAIAPRVWEAFRVAAGFSEVTAPDRGLLRDLPALGILERLASAASGRDPEAAASVEHLRSMLRAIVARDD